MGLAKPKSHAYSLLFKDSVIYGAGRAMQKFLTALMLPLFTTFLSKSDYGIVGMVVTVTTFLDVFVTLGFDIAFTRFYFDHKDQRNRSKVISHVFYVDFFYPAMLLGVLLAFMPQISELVMGAPGYTVYFVIGVATLFFTNLSDLPFTLLRLEHRAWTFTGFTLARVLIQVPMAVIFLAVFHLGPAGYLGANLLTAIILNLAALPIYVPQLRRLWDWELMKSMLAFAIPAMFTAISFFFLKLSDRFFLLHFQGTAEVGLYTVANALAQPLYIVGMAFRMAWPQWHYVKMNEPELHKRMVARSSTYFMAFNALLLVLVGMYLPIVMHALLDEDFWSIGPTTFVLTLSVALYNLYFIFWAGSNVAKKNRLIPVITLIASGVNVALNFVLVPTYGMWAAAWTTVLGFGILAVLVYFVLQALLPDPLRVAAPHPARRRGDAHTRGRLGDRVGLRGGGAPVPRPPRRGPARDDTRARRLLPRPLDRAVLHPRGARQAAGALGTPHAAVQGERGARAAGHARRAGRSGGRGRA